MHSPYKKVILASVTAFALLLATVVAHPWAPVHATGGALGASSPGPAGYPPPETEPWATPTDSTEGGQSVGTPTDPSHGDKQPGCDNPDCASCTYEEEACSTPACDACCAPSDDVLPSYLEQEGWALVGTQKELADALSDKQPRIRLRQDLQLTDTLYINHPVTLDGAKEGGGRWTLTDRRDGHSLRLNAPHLEVTVQNMAINGRDHYGPIRQENATYTNATVIYDNVVYSGPQIGHLRFDGTLVLRNSHITIHKPADSDDIGELAEATQVIFEGDVYVDRTVDDGDAMFWITNDIAAGQRQKEAFIRIADNANVVLDNRASYLSFRSNTNMDFLVGNNATLDVRTKLGWAYTVSHFWDNLIVGDHSRVTMTRVDTTDPGDLYKLYVRDSFQVGQDSVFILEDSVPIFRMGVDSSLQLHNPQLVRIDKGLIGGYGPASASLTAKAFNYWAASAPDSPPDGIYSAPAGEPVTITYRDRTAAGSYTDSATGDVVANADAARFLPFGNASLSQFAAGWYGLEIDPLSVFSTDITGTMSGDATLQADYYPREADIEDPSQRRTSTAVFTGQSASGLHGFLIDPGISENELGLGAFADRQAIDFRLVRSIAFEGLMLRRGSRLYAREQRQLAGAGHLAIREYPAVLDFGARDFPEESTYYPLAADAQVVVEDSRIGTKSKWNLIVSAESLQGGDGGAPGGLSIGVMRGGAFFALDSGRSIWTGQREAEPVQSKTWSREDRDNGLAVHVDPTQAAQGAYSAKVIWTLSVGPA